MTKTELEALLLAWAELQLASERIYERIRMAAMNLGVTPEEQIQLQRQVIQSVEDQS